MLGPSAQSFAIQDMQKKMNRRVFALQRSVSTPWLQWRHFCIACVGNCGLRDHV